MASKPGRQLDVFTGNLKKLVGLSASEKILHLLGTEAVKIIVRRTRLGRTARRTLVKDELGNIKNRVVRLKKHAPSYRQFRSNYREHLGEFTRWNRSNLTLSGQLLGSLGVRRVKNQQVIIGADMKKHRDFLTNETEPITNQRLAEIVTEAGRPFLELSSLDDKKLVRFYRRQFGDLQRRFGKKL